MEYWNNPEKSEQVGSGFSGWNYVLKNFSIPSSTIQELQK